MNTLRFSLLASSLLLVLSAVAADRKPVVANEGTIGGKWMLADGVTLAIAKYPAVFATRGTNACIALGYLIGEDGATSDFSVLKQWNSETGEKEPVEGFWQAFAQAGAEAVSHWKFKPRPDVDRPVPTYTVATLGFNGQQNVDGAKLREHCQIQDLGDRLAQLKSNPLRRGDYLKSSIEADRESQSQRDANREMERLNREMGNQGGN